MLLLSFGALVLTALLGGVLAALHLQAAAAHSQPSWPLRALHGLLGASGLVTLLLVLRGPPRGGSQPQAHEVIGITRYC